MNECPVCGNVRPDLCGAPSKCPRGVAQAAPIPLAWRYELAHARFWPDDKTAGEYTDWRWQVSETKPYAGDAMRNLTPLYALSSTPSEPAPAAASPTAEDIYACCRSTLIGFRDELTEQQIKFICDQIARKSILPSTERK